MYCFACNFDFGPLPSRNPFAAFHSTTNRQKLKLMSFELEEGEIPPYSELARGLEQALGRIQQLEAAVHSERQSRLAAEAANQ